MKYAPVNLYNKTTNVIMRKATYLFFVTLLIVTITSCSSDNDDIIQIKLLKKVIEINTDGTSSTFNFTYNDNKIASINSELNSKTFTYTDNLITKIIELDSEKQLQTTYDYVYKGTKLIKVICSDNYILNYTYNSDGTVSYEKTTKDVNNNIVLLFHGSLTILGGNVIDNKKIHDNVGVNILSKEDVSFVYDSKKNPFDNIIGFNKLLDQFKNISANNATSIVEIKSTTNLNTNQLISSAVQLPRVLQYDNDDYPTEIISDKPVFENQKGKHLKSLYFYE